MTDSDVCQKCRQPGCIGVARCSLCGDARGTYLNGYLDPDAVWTRLGDDKVDAGILPRQG